MTQPRSLRDFLASAKSQGLQDQNIVSLLRGRGWPQDEIYRALADHYEAASGVSLPLYKRSGSAKDAFIYLFSFSTLATWALGLGSVAFTVIDHWIKDQVASYPMAGEFHEMAGALASVIVAFPLYLLTMRYIVLQLEVHPEKLDSSVRKWLTYLALLMAACFALGDLITFLTSFLRGEVTLRFAAKVAVTLMISGGIFWYYQGSLASRSQKVGSLE